MAPPLIPLARCGIGDAEVVGREVAVLGRLLSAGVAVPEGVVLLPGAGELSDAALLREVSDLLGTGRHLVRASAVGDLGGAPEATLLGVETEAMVKAIRNCWASAAAVTPGCAVLVQRSAAATAAGTARPDPASGEPPSVLVSAAPAYGQLPTADQVSPDEWVVRDGVATCRRSAHDAVDAVTVMAVADLLHSVEKYLGGPQDVEWASEEGRVVLLRARHGTVLPEQIAVPIDVPEGFWERDASHSPKPWTPMLGSVFFEIRDAALRELFATFGLLAETLEFRQIGGREYTRLVPLGGKDRSPPPAPLMPLLARIVPAMRKRIRTCVDAVRGDAAGAMVDRWYAEWQPDLAARAAALRAQDVSALDDEALAAHTDLAVAAARRLTAALPAAGRVRLPGGGARLHRRPTSQRLWCPHRRPTPMPVTEAFRSSGTSDPAQGGSCCVSVAIAAETQQDSLAAPRGRAPIWRTLPERAAAAIHVRDAPQRAPILARPRTGRARPTALHRHQQMRATAARPTTSHPTTSPHTPPAPCDIPLRGAHSARRGPPRAGPPPR